MRIKKHLNLIFLLLGLIVLVFIWYKFGLNALQLLKENINFYYFSAFIFVTLIAFIPYTARMKVILDSYGKKVPLFVLLKQTICGFAVSYVTPAIRIGGEPVRIYMLKKESGINYKIGTTAVILDRFVEILGSALYGIIGLILIITLLDVPRYFEIVFGAIVFISLFILFIFYYRIIIGKGCFSDLFVFLRLNKIKKWKIFFYIICGILFIVEFKLLLLSIGINSSIMELILVINVWGLMNFVPTPASIGSLEAGQGGLFYFLSGMASIGLVVALLLRVAYLMIVCIGFVLIALFNIKQIKKK